MFFLFACGDAKWDNSSASPRQTTALEFSTFNLKFFGSGGGFNRKGVEPREKYLASFIKQELQNSDAILFSEVVHVPMLIDNLKDIWDCVSYNEDAPRSGWHQYLVLCYKPQLLRVEKFDEDYILPEHALGSRGLRPALQAKLCFRAQGLLLSSGLWRPLKSWKKKPLVALSKWMS